MHVRGRQRRDGKPRQPAPHNVLDRRIWTTREELRIAIVTWLERTYHRRRRQDRLGRLTPLEYEIIQSQAVEQAAKRPRDIL